MFYELVPEWTHHLSLPGLYLLILPPALHNITPTEEIYIKWKSIIAYNDVNLYSCVSEPYVDGPLGCINVEVLANHCFCCGRDLFEELFSAASGRKRTSYQLLGVEINYKGSIVL